MLMLFILTDFLFSLPIKVKTEDGKHAKYARGLCSKQAIAQAEAGLDTQVNAFFSNFLQPGALIFQLF